MIRIRIKQLFLGFGITMHPLTKNIVFSWASVSLWAILIFAGSVSPLGSCVPGGYGLDKISHFFAYVVLALLISGTMSKKRDTAGVKNSLFTLISAGVYGILIELVQSAIPYRTAEMNDILANYSGIIFGLIINRVAYGGNKAV